MEIIDSVLVFCDWLLGHYCDWCEGDDCCDCWWWMMTLRCWLLLMSSIMVRWNCYCWYSVVGGWAMLVLMPVRILMKYCLLIDWYCWPMGCYVFRWGIVDCYCWTCCWYIILLVTMILLLLYCIIVDTVIIVMKVIITDDCDPYWWIGDDMSILIVIVVDGMIWRWCIDVGSAMLWWLMIVCDDWWLFLLLLVIDIGDGIVCWWRWDDDCVLFGIDDVIIVRDLDLMMKLVLMMIDVLMILGILVLMVMIDCCCWWVRWPKLLITVMTCWYMMRCWLIPVIVWEVWCIVIDW